MKDSLTKRAGRAAKRQFGALALFEVAASELEAAAEQHKAVAAEAQEAADRYEAIRYEARSNAVAAEKSANNLRKLVNG